MSFELSGAIPHQDVLAVTNRPSSSPAVQALANAYFDHAGDSRWCTACGPTNYSYNGSFTTSSGIPDLPGRCAYGHPRLLLRRDRQLQQPGRHPGPRARPQPRPAPWRQQRRSWKPNYLSVMNYFYQLQGIGPGLRSLGLADASAGIDDFGYSGLRPAGAR